MSTTLPPLIARALAHLLVPVHEREWVLGDLAEIHAARVAREGVTAADRQYRRDVISLLGLRLSGSANSMQGERLRRSSMVRGFVDDVVHAWRGMRRQPGFHVVAILTLALGIGGIAAVFAMVNELVLRPLPGVTDSRNAAYLRFDPRAGGGPGQGTGISLPDFQELRANASLLEGIGSYGRMTAHVALGAQRPIEVMAGTIYGDFFEVLGVRAAAGRLIRAAETEVGGEERIAVLSEGLATSLFGSAHASVGRTLHVNGEPATVIGVAAGGFMGPERGDAYELWVPHPALVPLLGLSSERLTSRNSVMHSDLVVRLRSGVTPAAAQAQVAGIVARLASTHEESREHLQDLVPSLFMGLHVNPMMRAHTFASLRLLAGIVALVLLIACANAANLLLFRNVMRRPNLAMRRALGATSGRIVRQHLAESLVLAVSASMVGLAVAWLIVWQFRGENLMRMPAVTTFTMDLRVLAFAIAASLVTTVLFGAVPAALAGRFDLGAAVREGGGRDTRGLAGLRWLMSAAQIALSLTLLIGGLLLVRTLHKLYSADTGYDIENVATLSLQIRNQSGPLGAGEQRELLDAVRGVPAVESVAFDMYGPHSSQFVERVAHVGEPLSEGRRVASSPITADWFDVLGVDLIDGRRFTEEEANAREARGVVITAALAERLFGTTDVAGRRVQTRSARTPVDVEVIGVTEALRDARSPDVSGEGMFVPFGTLEFPAFTLLIRTREFNARVAEQIRTAVESVLPLQPVADPAPLTHRLDRIHAERRLFSRMLTLLSLLGVALAAIGLYAVVAFAVAGRVREFGIRLALGADRSRIARLVLDDAVRIVAVGAACGLFGAYLLSRLLENRLFGVERVDATSYIAAVVVFALVALTACWSPALTAARVDPINTLKAQ